MLDDRLRPGTRAALTREVVAKTLSAGPINQASNACSYGVRTRRLREDIDEQSGEGESAFAVYAITFTPCVTGVALSSLAASIPSSTGILMSITMASGILE